MILRKMGGGVVGSLLTIGHKAMDVKSLWFRVCRLITVGMFCLGTVSAEQPALTPAGKAHVEVTAQEVFSKPMHSRGEGTYVGKAIGGVLRDVFLLQVELFTWDTFKVVVGTLPFWVGGRMVDDKIHHCFYDRAHHKNLHQMHNGLYEFAKNSLAIPIVCLGTGVVWARDEEFRETSRVFLIGLPFVIWSKHLIKKVHTDSCKRPWNEHFSREKQAYGGFPSGHMAEIVYSTVLFGKRLGPKVAIPLGLVSAFLGFTFINCNRHYTSQIAAGAGLGVIYALAADKLITKNLERKHPVEMDLALNEHGKPEVHLGVSF